MTERGDWLSLMLRRSCCSQSWALECQTCTAYMGQQATATDAFKVPQARCQTAALQQLLPSCALLQVLACWVAVPSAPPVSSGQPSHQSAPAGCCRTRLRRRQIRMLWRQSISLPWWTGERSRFVESVFAVLSLPARVTDSRLCSTVIGQAQDGSRFRPCDGSFTVAWPLLCHAGLSQQGAMAPVCRCMVLAAFACCNRSSGPSQAPEVATFIA